MKLPVDGILAYLLPSDDPITFEFPSEHELLSHLPLRRPNVSPAPSSPKQSLAIMRVNLQLYHECFRLLYQCRYFRFNIFYTSGCFAALRIFQSFPLDRVRVAHIKIELIHPNAWLTPNPHSWPITQRFLFTDKDLGGDSCDADNTSRQVVLGKSCKGGVKELLTKLYFMNWSLP